MRIVLLSEEFYRQYGNKPEIMEKHERPYYCLEIKKDSKTYAIPFRHHIKHQYCFHTIDDAGIDYTKAVVISDENMISGNPARIETAEWRIIKRNEDKIYAGFSKYLRLFAKAKNHSGIQKYDLIVSMSALQYFN